MWANTETGVMTETAVLLSYPLPSRILRPVGKVNATTALGTAEAAASRS